jgi:hypothetical protein
MKFVSGRRVYKSAGMDRSCSWTCAARNPGWPEWSISPGNSQSGRRSMAPFEASGKTPSWQKGLARSAGWDSARSQVPEWRGSEACMVDRPRRNGAV